MSNFNKKLEKAEKFYKEKNYKDALKLCDKVLAKDYNNEKALELEGEILFKLDRVDEAILSWKINAEYNSNPTAKMRLADIDKSVKETALSYENLNEISSIPESEIEEVVNPVVNEVSNTIDSSLEAEATKSEDTNSTETEEIFTPSEVLKEEPIHEDVIIEDNTIDIHDPSSNEDIVIDEPSIEFENNLEVEDSEGNIINNKDDSTYEVENKDLNSSKISQNKSSNKGKKAAILAVCAIIVVAASYGAVKHFSADKTAPQTEQAKTQIEDKPVDQNLQEDLTKAMDNKDYSALYTLLEENPKDKAPKEVEKTYDDALNIMKTDGIQKFYDTGLEDYKNNNFQGALDNFTKAYNFSEGSYLEPHLIYFMGATNTALKKNDDAIKYYKEYLEKYPKSDMYNAEVLYNLALYYNEAGDKNEAKKYAQNIEDTYPSSPYYNDTLKNILYN